MIDEPSLIKKKKFEIKSIKNVIVIALILIVSVVGVSYAFFDYYKINNNQLELIAGEMYLNLVDGTSDLRLETTFPQTVSEARNRTDNVITFDITGKNTSENKIIWYEIMLNEGIEEAGKTRFKPEHLLFDLVEIIDGNERMVVNAVSYDEFNKTRIWVNTVNSNTDKEITITYKLRMWLSEDVIISDTESYADYTTDVYRNSYASVKVEVYGDFKEKKVVTLASTLETSLAANLTEPDVDGTRYVNGETVDNNYVWYSGKMWRVVALNADGTVKLVTQNNMTAITWATNSSNIDYSTSQIRSWLKNEFLPTINSNLIVDSEWDYTLYSNFPSSKITENVIEVNDKVGLISIYDYMMTGGTNETSTSSTFLNNGYAWWTMSLNDTLSWRVYAGGFATNIDYPVNDGKGCGVRPSVNLKSDITLTGEGNGELETPYMLEDDTQIGQANELLSSRISGEYIKFNNVKYRIVGIENGLTKVTMTDYSVNNNSIKFYQQFGETADESGVTFNINSGIGKYLNDWYNGNILDSAYKAMMATSENDGIVWHQGPDIGGWGDYTLSKTGPEIKATVGLGSYGEMFASQYGTGESGSIWTWLMTKYSSTAVHFIGAIGDVNIQNPTVEYAVRPSFYLKPNVKIESGSGLPNDPYEIYQDTLASTFSTKLANNLTEPDVDGTRYVTGETVDNNYVWYSGKMWRIVALNADGTVKLVTQNAMTSIAWSTDSTNTNYTTSQIRSWLNTEFLPTINTDLIVESNWDYTTYASFPTEKDTENAISVSDKVGLLSVYDYMMTGGTDGSSTSKTYLNNGYYWWMTSPIGGSGVWGVNNSGGAHNGSPTGSYGVRPSINLKSDITITGEGNGELETPYTLEDDTQLGQANELLSSRISGEYINFNNTKYRIIGVENGLTKITMADYSVNKNTLSISLSFGASTDEITFSTTYGIGKYLDGWYNATSETDTSGTYTGLYLSETAKAMIATPSDGVRWYAGPDNGGINFDYTKATQGTAIEATIGLGRYGEMLSTQFGPGSSSSVATWLMTKHTGSYVWNIYINGYAYFYGPTSSIGVRPSMYLKSNVKITGGSGMPHDAYTISQ